MKTKNRICFEATSLPFSPRLEQQPNNLFKVVYGSAVNYNLRYDKAASYLGMAIMHALACDGKLDNSDVRREDYA